MILLASSLLVILTSVVVFFTLVLLLVIVLLYTKEKLTPSGNLTIRINDEKELSASGGGTLLSILQANGIFLSSACGGGGSCGQCRCQVVEGGGEILPTETGFFTRKEIKDHWRLGCQTKVKENLSIRIAPEVFGVKSWECEVVSNYNVASFIKEFVVKLPEGEEMNFLPGSYIQIEVPSYKLRYADIDVKAQPGSGEEDRFRPEWDKYRMWKLNIASNEPVSRAYSMANHPAEGNIVMLNVRIATPPFDKASGTWKPGVKPGVASSYLFSLKPGDKVKLSGPYGDFHIVDAKREMLYIGGGAGMAPLRSHLMHLFHTLNTTDRKVSYWYGARSKNEVFYEEDFRAIERAFPNFSFHLALSEPLEEDHWTGYTGFIHQVIYDQYLSLHEEPEEVEYYMCGPTLMANAVKKMLDNLGVPPEMLLFDDFG